jgi:hypothetical protein
MSGAVSFHKVVINIYNKRQHQNGYFFKLLIYVVNCMILNKGMTLMIYQ